MTDPARAAYEADVRRCPLYPDGGPRRAWEELDDTVRWWWGRLAAREAASRLGVPAA